MPRDDDVMTVSLHKEGGGGRGWEGRGVVGVEVDNNKGKLSERRIWVEATIC